MWLGSPRQAVTVLRTSSRFPMSLCRQTAGTVCQPGQEGGAAPPASLRPQPPLPAQGRASLGLSEDVDDAFPLGGNRRPVLGQGHHSTCVQQPVAIRVAHCGAEKAVSAGRQRAPHAQPACWATLSSPFRPTPLVAQSLALRWAGFEVCTTRCCMSRQVRFLLQRGQGEVGLSLSGERPRAALQGALVGTRALHPSTYLASRVRAMMPAAKGAEAEVPV